MIYLLSYRVTAKMNNLSNKDKVNYLVTGGAGFIGYHVCKSLLKDNNEVVIIDNLSNYYDSKLKKDRLEKLEKVKIYIGDITDTDFVKSVLKENKIKFIIHLAAQVGVQYSLDNPFEYENTNNLGTLSIFESAKDLGIDNLIYASSSSVYGGNKKIPFSVDDNVDNPISLYAASKRYNELLAHSYYHLYGIKSTGLRFFTVYGPWGRPDMAIYKFTDAIVNNQPIYLNNHGDHLRDFTYIDDIVSGIKAAISHNNSYSLYNLGNNKPTKLIDLVDLLESIIGKKADKKQRSLQKGDVYATYADIKESQKDLGWVPEIDIKEGLINFYSWYKDYYKV